MIGVVLVAIMILSALMGIGFGLIGLAQFKYWKRKY
jgi:hypothetical protein